jgi:hypothetical protein
LRSPGDAPLFQQRLEREEQVEIDGPRHRVTLSAAQISPREELSTRIAARRLVETRHRFEGGRFPVREPKEF